MNREKRPQKIPRPRDASIGSICNGRLFRMCFIALLGAAVLCGFGSFFLLGIRQSNEFRSAFIIRKTDAVERRIFRVFCNHKGTTQSGSARRTNWGW